MPSGSMRVDVRLTLKTDDGALIYIAYNGVLKESAENEAKAGKEGKDGYVKYDVFAVH